ncbi:MAG: MerR family transcriptional regulator [Longibaculum sp.]
MYIQELSEKLKISKKAINLYEQKGLIHPQKDQLGYRVYSLKDQQILMKVKLLRQMNFSISEIKDVLINKNFQIFQNKKEEYQKQVYDIETSIQYIDSVQEYIENDEDIDELSQHIENIYELKNIKTSFTATIHFYKVAFVIAMIASGFALKSNGQDDIYEWIAGILLLLAMLIILSTKIRLLIFKIFEIIKKIV